MNEDSFAFTIFMIHELAESWKKLPCDVFHILKSSGCIDNYLVPYYDVLHTLGSQYLVEDIGRYVQQRGYNL